MRDANANPRFSMVIPAYNEERRLPASLRDMLAFFGAAPNESGPPTSRPSSCREEFRPHAGARARDDRARSALSRDRQSSPSRQGLRGEMRNAGGARRRGVLHGRGSLDPARRSARVSAHFEEHPETDVLIGSRALAKSQIVRKQTWIRRNLGRGFNRFVRGFGLSGVTGHPVRNSRLFV